MSGTAVSARRPRPASAVPSAIAAVLWGTCVLVAAPTAVLLVLAPGGLVPSVDSDIFAGLGGAAFLLLGLTFASVGVLVARREPHNGIGWIFCVTGLSVTLNVLTWAYLDVALGTAHDLAGTTSVAVVNSVISEQTAAWLGLSLLLFPDGRLPSRRWWPALAVLVGGMALLALAGGLTPGAYNAPFAAITNPIGLDALGSLLRAVDAVGWILVVVGFALGALALVVRLRRARGAERQQLKLVLAVGSVAAVVTTILMVTWVLRPEGHLPVRMAVLGMIFASFPVACGFAILRYRLFDIDRIVSRTISYAAVTVLLAASYVGLVLLGQALFSSFAGGSNLAIAVSTLVVAALFLPVRARVQSVVDRRFNRRRYDAQRTLERFGASLREQIELEALTVELRAVVGETVQPVRVGVWLRSGRE